MPSLSLLVYVTDFGATGVSLPGLMLLSQLRAAMLNSAQKITVRNTLPFILVSLFFTFPAVSRARRPNIQNIHTDVFLPFYFVSPDKTGEYEKAPFPAPQAWKRSILPGEVLAICEVLTLE
jgi:hypothetical protein